MAPLSQDQRQQAVLERRHWVRLTWCCNNHCRFCHDSGVHDGTAVSVEQLETEIRSGVEQGCQRLVLSGGEPTLHPAFLELVALGKRSGYRWVQVVTNGRMFAYPGFAARALAAGLDEVTLSMHGHTQALHDRLVGVEGAFLQSLKGLENLQRAGPLVISVDVVLNALNLPQLPALLDFFLDRGIREFDLLWLVPFGRAWDNRAELFVPAGQPTQSLHEAIERATMRQAVVWTNRLPAWLLEGREELIQDPHKLHDEVRGRRKDLELRLSDDQPLRCRQPERCAQCFLQGFCDLLEELACQRAAGRFEALEVDLAADPVQEGPWARTGLLRLTGAPASRAATFVRSLGPGARNLVLVLDRPPRGDPRRFDWGSEGALLRVASNSADCLDASLAIPGLGVEVVLDSHTADWIRKRSDAIGRVGERILISTSPGGVSGNPDHQLVEPRAALAPLAGSPIGLLDLPWCSASWARRVREKTMLAHGVLDERAAVDLERFTESYLLGRYRVFSARCAGCSGRDQCPGLAIELARRFGFGNLQSLPPGNR